MFQPNNQLTIHPKALSIQDPSGLMHVDQNDSPVIARDDMQNGGFAKAESIVCNSKKLQDDLQMLGLKIQQHENNIKFLKNQKNNLDDCILDMQVILGKYHSSSVPMTENEDPSHIQSEEETIEQILRHEKSAAAILCQLKTRHGSQASHLSLTKDVLGIVATLGKVDDDNLGRLLSEYLGIDTMLAIVCKNYEGAKALELYDTECCINKSSGLHGLGASIGRPLDGRFRVICLESLRPYVGEFLANDPQKRLDLLKPRLPSGECPSGFLGFAVNMIHVDSANLFCLTASGHGLRETLFYTLFSRLQVYKTRADMQLALPCISDGALSLDGGMVRATGVFSFGNREDVDVRFPKSSGMSNLPVNYFETENKIRETKWKKERLLEDIQREQALLDHTKFNFGIKKQEFVKFLAESSSYMTQHQIQAARDRLTPR
ncbi:hypothetical protein L1049_019335 [Liquidambar formosana]|uniref:Protein DEFECTIVE IN MERISTEM SILENCING 3-like n=1 Tax=Liquidambar formosana TaxID=63359 RepID=A0AAP0S811_LIQFO